MLLCIAMILLALNLIPRQIHGRRVQIAAHGMGSLVITLMLMLLPLT
ncbi:hypothetical protein Gotri_027653 [Gossypium trilobum]|uniref:Uncharacterized protein n=1 Tax=Gossypium trilobum TaxID=34281 RepID=A0A7J9FLN4_9ROSI|nr:hypothetical protein [Gossypium trilobum]